LAYPGIIPGTIDGVACFEVSPFMQSDLRDLSVFVMILLAEDYCRLFLTGRSDEEPTTDC